MILQIGIVSYGGTNCGDGKYPGVYTRVSRFYKWIMKRTQDATYCGDVFYVPRTTRKVSKSFYSNYLYY